ncbi:hypothetical protein Dda_6776 [Drechslerella dactyloides]|uniref:Uncharacterized protein n=1 Tax=Drechslerella dactyloides TaxID=74499 RepID=A0AAD6IU67_DREDA|nr:hypothetical protein Dda_6776 [Drechslerella dactyloides]
MPAPAWGFTLADTSLRLAGQIPQFAFAEVLNKCARVIPKPGHLLAILPKGFHLWGDYGPSSATQMPTSHHSPFADGACNDESDWLMGCGMHWN